jgi:hypothetical protein
MLRNNHNTRQTKVSIHTPVLYIVLQISSLFQSTITCVVKSTKLYLLRSLCGNTYTSNLHFSILHSDSSNDSASSKILVQVP